MELTPGKEGSTHAIAVLNKIRIQGFSSSLFCYRLIYISTVLTRMLCRLGGIVVREICYIEELIMPVIIIIIIIKTHNFSLALARNEFLGMNFKYLYFVCSTYEI